MCPFFCYFAQDGSIVFVSSCFPLFWDFYTPTLYISYLCTSHQISSSSNNKSIFISISTFFLSSLSHFFLRHFLFLSFLLPFPLPVTVLTLFPFIFFSISNSFSFFSLFYFFPGFLLHVSPLCVWQSGVISGVKLHRQ